MQRVVKYYYISFYMLKTSSRLTQIFNENKEAQEKLFNHMCNFGAWEEWNRKRAISSYLDFEIRND